MGRRIGTSAVGVAKQLSATLAAFVCLWLPATQATAIERFTTSLDLEFGEIHDLAVYPPGPHEGEVVVVASFGDVYRLQEDGTLDPNFGRRGVVRVRDKFQTEENRDTFETVAVDSVGRIIVGGRTGIGSMHYPVLARLKPSGRLDRGFDPGEIWAGANPEDGSIYDLAIDDSGPSDRIVAFGRDSWSGRVHLWRLADDGTPDPTFDGDGLRTFPEPFSDDETDHRPCCVAVQADGKVVMAVTRNIYPGSLQRRFWVARFDEDGSPDAEFGDAGSRVVAVGDPAYDSVPFDFALHEAGPDAGKIVIAGETGPHTDELKMAIAQLDSEGDLDEGFGMGGTMALNISQRADFARAVGVDDAGHVFVAGTSAAGVPEQYFGRLLRFSDGALDPGFDEDGIATFPDGPDFPIALEMDPYGPVVAGGDMIQWVGEREDTVPPETWLDAGPREDGIVRDRRVRFEFSSNDPDVWFRCRIDDQPYSYCASPFVLRRISGGPHVFSVRAKSMYGGLARIDPTAAQRQFEVRAG